MFSRSTAGEGSCDWMSWSSRHLWNSVGILNLCYNLGIKKTIYLNSRSQAEMNFLYFFHIDQSFCIHQAIWSGLLDVKRMRVDSKSGHSCSDLQHHRGGWGQDVLCRGTLKTFVSGAGQKTVQEPGHKMFRWIKWFPACPSRFEHTCVFLWEQCGFEAWGLPLQVPSGLRWLWIRLMCHPECLIISGLA